MEALDRKIISLFTKISHKFQRLTGRTNFFLAKYSLSLCVFSLFIDVADYFLPYFLKRQTSLWLTAVSVGILIFIGMNDLPKLDRAEASALAETEAAKEHFTFSGMGGYLWRMVWFFAALAEVCYFIPKAILSGSGFWDVLNGVYGTGLFLCAYFVEVSPLPPSKSKLREWAESLASDFQKPVMVPVKRPR